MRVELSTRTLAVVLLSLLLVMSLFVWRAAVTGSAERDDAPASTAGRSD